MQPVKEDSPNLRSREATKRPLCPKHMYVKEIDWSQPENSAWISHRRYSHAYLMYIISNIQQKLSRR